MRKKLINVTAFVAGVTILAGAAAALAQPEDFAKLDPRAATCTMAQDDLASKRLGAAKRLMELYHIENEFPGCAGGGISEEVSDDVVTRLAKHWEQAISELYLHKGDAKFVAFVLSHIDATTNGDDLERIVEHSRVACPAQYRAICARVQKAAKAALSDEA